MALNVYSQRLWSAGPFAAPGTQAGPAVPAGFTWVVRDVRWQNTSNFTGYRVSPAILETATGIVLAATGTFTSIVGQLYEWQGRSILRAGEQLQFTSQSSSWKLVVDGYQLTGP